MRSFWIILNALFVLTLSFEALGAMNTSRAPSSEVKQASCKYVTGDVGTILGLGENKNKALAHAIEQCFDRRVKIFEQARQTTVDMDRGQDIIDSCVNIRCS